MSGGPMQAASSYDGYAVPDGRYVAERDRGPRYVLTLGLWVLILTVGMMILALVDSRVADVPSRYVCPPDCGRPPIGLPVATNPRFTAPGGEFSVSYPAPGTAYTVDIQPNGITAEWTAGDGGTLRLFSQPAGGRDAKQIAKTLIEDGFPAAWVAYELPNATVGYHPGYGEVADAWPQNTGASYSRVRIVVTTAVKNDLALIAFATGPYRAFGPDCGPRPPSGANLQLAQDMGKYVNSFQWRGDPPR